jgi:hypothetical protein
VTLTLAEILLIAPQFIKQQKKHACQKHSSKYQLSLAEMTWLAMLVKTRSIYIIPAANCIGYTFNRRDDMGVDPNRDFPYVRKDNNCLQSSTAQLIYRLMSSRRIDMLVTFHGGMEAIAYEWGSLNHKTPNDRSPDHNAHKAVASVLANAAGHTKFSPKYRTGTMNSLVYPVDGGMEDWAYAGSWDRSNNKRCNGQKNISENEIDFRCAVFLVETSNRKMPSEISLGSSDELLQMNNSFNGHIPRNVRLSLAAVDMVEPYVCVSSVAFEGAGSADTQGLRINWTVGGAVIVDSTWLSLKLMKSSNVGDPITEQGGWFLRKQMKRHHAVDFNVNVTVAQSGTGHQSMKTLDSGAFTDVISSHILLNEIDRSVEGGGRVGTVTIFTFAIVASAECDKDWAASEQGNPRLPSQTWLANSRSGNRGKHPVHWRSDPVIVEVIVNGTSASFSVVTAELDCMAWPQREAPVTGMFIYPSDEFDRHDSGSTPISVLQAAILVIAVMALVWLLRTSSRPGRKAT